MASFNDSRHEMLNMLVICYTYIPISIMYSVVVNLTDSIVAVNLTVLIYTPGENKIQKFGFSNPVSGT